ncbi:purine-nucleoside phosphorylase [Vallitalea okinawensis]|uniref:purine-nucleoside phosphorylase n=1 Tax=Vallitalea okinawensis TaxID=2078660 RepID=UPI000CFD42AD|nr:purine-nucleoside phosphorylase [Vallitalea okinawensis]
MATPHIEAKKGEIAKTVLMPGDPLRAKFIAETFLENVKQFNQVRGMLGFTGTYKGREISVMGHGMGQPSVGIYSYELFKFYDVENIVRIGSCGAYSEDLDLYDVIIVEDAYSESSFAKVQCNEERDVLEPSQELTSRLEGIANDLNIPYKKGRIHSSDVFYSEDFKRFERLRDEKDCIAVEMESFALFNNANVLGKNAACVLTVSDHLVTHEETSSSERQTAFTKMMEIALELAE